MRIVRKENKFRKKFIKGLTEATLLVYNELRCRAKEPAASRAEAKGAEKKVKKLFKTLDKVR